MQLFLGRNDDPCGAWDLPGLHPPKAFLAKLLHHGVQIQRGEMIHVVQYESEGLSRTANFAEIEQFLNQIPYTEAPQRPAIKNLQPRVCFHKGPGIQPVKQVAAAHKFLIASTDLLPLFLVFGAAEILESRKLALFLKFTFQLCDLVVFRIVQIAQHYPAHTASDLLRAGLCRQVRWDVQHEDLIGDRSIEERNTLGNLLGIHLPQEK